MSWSGKVYFNPCIMFLYIFLSILYTPCTCWPFLPLSCHHSPYWHALVSFQHSHVILQERRAALVQCVTLPVHLESVKTVSYGSVWVLCMSSTNLFWKHQIEAFFSTTLEIFSTKHTDMSFDWYLHATHTWSLKWCGVWAARSYAFPWQSLGTINSVVLIYITVSVPDLFPFSSDSPIPNYWSFLTYFFSCFLCRSVLLQNLLCLASEQT